jgi:ParB-like chromosome segregation protein Spo0J
MAKHKGAAKIAKKNEVLKALDISYVTHDKIVPNTYNPNRQSEDEFELLKRSMTEDGFTQPIVCVQHEDQEGMYRIVDGEHRWRCSKELGYEEIPIVVTPMTYEQARIATLRHNRARGSEDIELTSEVLRDLENLGALDWAQDSLMMDDLELQRMLEDIPAPEAMEAEEFGTAWIPTDADTAEDSVQAVAHKTNDGVMIKALSPEALAAQRQVEEKIKAAKSEEERSMAVKEANFYRLNLVFSGEEADVVKEALGNEPASTLIDMCKAIKK